VLGNDTDPDNGDVLTVTGATVDPAKGTVIVNPDGTLTFTPAANINGPVEVTYTISDGHGGTATSTATINIAPVNDAPLAQNDAASTTEDAAVSRNALTGVLANDSDIDSPTLTVSGARSGTTGAFASPGSGGVTLTGTYGSLLIHADGSYTYTPGAAAQALNTGDSVQDVFSYQVSDGSLNANATLSITVTGVNDAAVISGTASGIVKEDVTAQLTATGALSATDVDSANTFTPSSATGTYGSFSIGSDGVWTYTLNNAAANVQALKEGDVRTETFTVNSADGTAHTVSITVQGTNEVPTVTNASATGSEDPAAPIPVTLTGTDVDGTVTSLSLADLPVHGTLYRDAAMTQPVSAGTALSATAGSVTLYFKPDANWNGNTSFHFTATDNNGGTSNQGTASLSVTAVNDPPVAIADTGSTDQNTPLIRTAGSGVLVNDSDVDSNTLLVTRIAAGSNDLAVAAGGTSIAGNFGSLLIKPDGSYSYVPNSDAKALTLGQSATDVFTYTVSDGSGGTATTTLTIDVSGKNDAPVIGGVATGNVVEDGTTTASGVLTISDADAGQSSFQPQTLTGTYGSLSLLANGNWTYTLNNAASNVQGLKQGEQVVDHINVLTADGTVKDVAITVTGTNDAPVVGNATVNVSEEGLAGGIADTIGSADTTNLTTASGVIALSDTDGNALTATLTAPTTALSSGGVAITWSGSGTHTLIGSAGGVEILRATIADDGSYSVKLSGPIDHADTTREDLRSIAIDVLVTDNITTTKSTLTVNVEDDSPMASASIQTIAVAPVDTNLLLMLDVSGSMISSDGVGGASRLASAISALNSLLDSYDSFGEVRVRLVTFSSTASAVGSAWTTVADAKAQLAAISATGGTNYDAALAAGQTAFTSSGKLASGQNIAYFLSDGQPNTGTDIGSADETAWKGFLHNNQITSFALGMGTGASQGPLDPIAYNGATDTNLNGQVITDFNKLANALQATVPQPSSGELLSGGLLGATTGFGADGGNIRSITLDGVTYTYNPAGNGSVAVSGGTSHGTYDAVTHQLSVVSAAGGTLVMNLNTGSYTYTPVATVTSAITDGFSFVLVDRDGDTASSSVTFNVSRAAENIVNLASTTTGIANASLGLTGEFYGYNETTSASNTRTHADDTKYGNLDHVSDMVGIIDTRSGQTVVGTYNAATAGGADATFSADKLDYGFGYTTGSTTVGAVNGNLGANPTLGTDLSVNTGALYNFLRGGTTGSDASTLRTTTGIGTTTDSGLRMVGLVNLDGGTYDIRVTADDGFRLNIAGQTVAMFDDIQSPTARTYTGVSLASGLQPIEILYWEQGGNARLRVEVKLSSEPDTSYKTLGTDDFALFTPTSAPTLSSLQDIIEDPNQNGHWLIRTGQELTGSAGNDHITGSDGRDAIYGGSGSDTILGGGGADLIAGGAGNDTLTGGLGSDTFKWSLGDAGSAGKPALDAITDFNKASAVSGGDVLDLRDLLQGESHTGTATGNLGSYLHFEKSGSDTVVHVSSTGGYTGGTFTAGATDQKVILQGVDLTNGGTLATDSQIIQDLLTKGKLSAD
jgi:large repetitive protein